MSDTTNYPYQTVTVYERVAKALNKYCVKKGYKTLKKASRIIEDFLISEGEVLTTVEEYNSQNVKKQEKF